MGFCVLNLSGPHVKSWYPPTAADTDGRMDGESWAAGRERVECTAGGADGAADNDADPAADGTEVDVAC